VRAHLGHDLPAETRARVEHGDHDAEHAQARVETLADELDRPEQLGEPLERVVLGLHRDERLAGGGQPIHGEQSERRRAVDEHELVGAEGAVQGVAQDGLALGHAGELNLGAGEVGAGGRDAQVVDRRRQRHVGQRDAPAQHAVHRQRGRIGGDAQSAARVALRVEIDEQGGKPGLGEAGGDVHRGGRLAHAALLVGDGDDARHDAVRPRPAVARALDLARALGILPSSYRPPAGPARNGARTGLRQASGRLAAIPGRRGKRSGVGATFS
jgi:hypothetical protein